MAGGRLVLPSTDPVLTSGGLLNVGATLMIYDTGTTNLSSLFADIGLTTPIANPQTSNAAGRFYTQATQVCVNAAAAYDCILHLTDGETFTYTALYAVGAPVNTAGFLQNPNVALTGVPTAPTPAANDSSSKIATTQFVAAALAAVSIFSPGSAGIFFMVAIPSGWLRCDGSAVSRTTYAALFSAIGTTFGAGDTTTTFNLPDTRGYFVRGFDSGGGVDPSRAFGSKQTDAFQGHFHGPGGTGGAFEMSSGGSGTVQTGSGSSTNTQTNTGSPVTDGSSGTPRTAIETRPVNIALAIAIHT